MLISGFIKLLTLVRSGVMMSSLLSEAALHYTSQQTLHKPQCCCFFQVHGQKIPCTAASHPLELLHSPSMSAFRPSSLSKNCPGCRHCLVVLRQHQPCPAQSMKTMSSPALRRCFGSFAFFLSSLCCWSSSPACTGALVVTQGTQLVTGDCAAMLSVVSACWFLFLWGV